MNEFNDFLLNVLINNLTSKNLKEFNDFIINIKKRNCNGFQKKVNWQFNLIFSKFVDFLLTDKIKKKSEMFKIEFYKSFEVLLTYVKIKSFSLFSNILFTTLKSNFYQETSISNDLQTFALKFMFSLITNHSKKEKIYNISNDKYKNIFGFALYIHCDLIKKNNDKNVIYFALNNIISIIEFTSNTQNQQKSEFEKILVYKSAKLFLENFFPGTFSALFALLKRDINLTIKCYKMALKCLSKLIIVIYNDKINENLILINKREETNVKKLCFEKLSFDFNTDIKNDSRISDKNAENVEKRISLIFYLNLSCLSNPMIFKYFTECAGNILLNCYHSLTYLSIVNLLKFILVSGESEYDSISIIANDFILKSKNLISSDKLIKEEIKECLFQQLSVTKNFDNYSQEKKLLLLNKVKAYFRFCAMFDDSFISNFFISSKVLFEGFFKKVLNSKQNIMKGNSLKNIGSMKIKSESIDNSIIVKDSSNLYYKRTSVKGLKDLIKTTVLLSSEKTILEILKSLKIELLFYSEDLSSFKMLFWLIKQISLIKTENIQLKKFIYSLAIEISKSKHLENKVLFNKPIEKEYKVIILLKIISYCSVIIKNEPQSFLSHLLQPVLEKSSSKNQLIKKAAIKALNQFSSIFNYSSIETMLLSYFPKIINNLTFDFNSLTKNSHLICSLIKNNQLTSSKSLVLSLSNAFDRVFSGFSADLHILILNFPDKINHLLSFIYSINISIKNFKFIEKGIETYYNQKIDQNEKLIEIESVISDLKAFKKALKQNVKDNKKYISNKGKDSVISENGLFFSPNKTKNKSNLISKKEKEKLEKCVSNMVKKIIPLASHPNKSTKHIVLDIFKISVENLSDSEDLLLVTIADIWELLKLRFTDKNISIAIKAFEIFHTMLSFSGKFLKRRFNLEFWPILEKVLSEYKIKKEIIKNKKVNFNFKLAEKIFECLIKIMVFPKIIKTKTEKLTKLFCKFLSSNFYLELEFLVIKVFKKLATINCDCVWWVLYDFKKNCQNKDFKEYEKRFYIVWSHVNNKQVNK